LNPAAALATAPQSGANIAGIRTINNPGKDIMKSSGNLSHRILITILFLASSWTVSNAARPQGTFGEDGLARSSGIGVST
jgi:hypothetical protein